MTEPLPQQTSDVHLRIYGEFVEMPGLRLTLDQVCRLWSLDPVTAGSALQDLVDAAVLRRVGPYYVRADIGTFCA